MKNIFKIYKKDLKDVFTNKVLLVIIGGLAFLPSLYAWFNIKASWDPYGSTKNISVAIVNNDIGTTIKDKKINIGDELVKKLKENKDLGWKFVDKEKAISGVKNGTYYASVEIPKVFSKDLTSLTTNNIKKGKIVYTVNEKINAIAPKITDKGASTIQSEVNKTVVKTVSEIIFELSNNLGLELENQIPKLSNLENELISIQNKFKDINKTINLASDANYKMSELVKSIQKDIPLIKETITNSKNLASNTKSFLTDSKSSLNNISPIIKEDLKIISQISSNASSSVSTLIDALNKGSENAPLLVNSLYDKLTNLQKTNETLLSFLQKLNNFSKNNVLKGSIESLQSINNKLTSAINSLEVVKGQINNNQKPSLDNLNNILKVTNDINQISSSLLNNFDSKISNPINQLFNDSFKVADEAIVVLNKAQEKLPSIEDTLGTALEFSGNANDSIKYIKQKLPVAKSVVDDLVVAMKKINSSEDISELIDLLKSDSIKRSEFLKQPVNLVTEKLYPVSNYGSAMTPFYTVLSLWVGVLLLMSLLSTEVHGDYKSYEIYLGRGLIFLTVSIVQALIVSLGDLYLLKVQATNPGLLVLLSVFTSIVFTCIVYSLVSMFGNVGKAIGVILLVIQVAASGGTFPIQVTPEFFQIVNPFLPFTYSIGALRETVGGIYNPNLTKSILILLAFLIVPVILTLLLKKPINNATASLRAKFNESDLTGH